MTGTIGVAGSRTSGSPDRVSDDITLTLRQAEFLALSAQGLNRTDISKEFCISPWTVKNTLQEAKGRLGARSLPQAVAKAIAFGLIVVDQEGTAIAI